MKKFFENLWYHYKTYIIVFGLLLIVGIIVLVNLISRTEPDLRVIIYTETAVYDSDVATVEKTLADAIGDLNGDGKTEIVAKNIYYGSTLETTLYEQLTVEMTQGSATLILCDEGGVRTLLKYGSETIADISGKVDETCYDGRGVRIDSTELFSENKMLPKSLVIFLRNVDLPSFVAALDYVMTLEPVTLE